MKNSTDIEVMVFFDILSKTTSTLKKKQLISEKARDRNVLLFLDYLLNPFFVTGISEKKFRRPVNLALAKLSNRFNSFHDLMNYIRENHTGSEEVMLTVHGFLMSVNEEIRWFYAGIITKSIRLGCDVKTVNDALGFELIPMWEVQQSYKIDNVKLNDNEWFSLSQKLNGVRGTFFEGKIISRQGKEFSGLEHILNDIRELFINTVPDPYMNYEDWVIDGELIRNNTDGIPDNENFRITTGILNQENGDKSEIQFVIFDILPKEEFIRGESKLRYKDRKEILNEIDYMIKSLRLDSIKIVDILYSGTDTKMIDVCLDKMVEEGKEGIMLNRDSKYMRKRHSGILKIKRFYTMDLRIIDILEGSGRLKGTLGAFVVRYKDNVLRVGSGMSDEQRDIFWNERESLIGRVIEVKYKEESRDKETGKPSLQFPIFVRLREEGKQVSYD